MFFASFFRDFLLSLDIISAPASQAYVERVFSVCGMLTTGHRNRMTKSFQISGVARVLRAPVQRHVVGPLVIKQLSNSFAARNGRSQCVAVG